MTDTISRERRSANMRQIRSKHMAPELAVRKMLFAHGYRYQIHVRSLPGKPDIVFGRKRKVVFVHGCFWHQHGSRTCKIARMPRSNVRYWRPKLIRNAERDSDHVKALKKEGWTVLTVWECEVQKVGSLVPKLKNFLGPPR